MRRRGSLKSALSGPVVHQFECGEGLAPRRGERVAPICSVKNTEDPSWFTMSYLVGSHANTQGKRTAKGQAIYNSVTLALYDIVVLGRRVDFRGRAADAGVHSLTASRLENPKPVPACGPGLRTTFGRSSAARRVRPPAAASEPRNDVAAAQAWPCRVRPAIWDSIPRCRCGPIRATGNFTSRSLGLAALVFVSVLAPLVSPGFGQESSQLDVADERLEPHRPLHHTGLRSSRGLVHSLQTNHLATSQASTFRSLSAGANYAEVGGQFTLKPYLQQSLNFDAGLEGSRFLSASFTRYHQLKKVDNQTEVALTMPIAGPLSLLTKGGFSTIAAYNPRFFVEVSPSYLLASNWLKIFTVSASFDTRYSNYARGSLVQGSPSLTILTKGQFLSLTVGYTFGAISSLSATSPLQLDQPTRTRGFDATVTVKPTEKLSLSFSVLPLNVNTTYHATQRTTTLAGIATYTTDGGFTISPALQIEIIPKTYDSRTYYLKLGKIF